MPKKLPEAAKSIEVVLAATDPANPYGNLIPWPPRDDDARNPQRAPGAKVILRDGALLAWLARGGQSIVTFLPREEPERGHRIEALTDALASIAKKRVRPMILATIDGVPAPAFSSSLAYYDGLRAERLPAALIQGQRDFFGAHTYRRVDRDGSFHTEWAGNRTEIVVR